MDCSSLPAPACTYLHGQHYREPQLPFLVSLTQASTGKSNLSLSWVGVPPETASRASSGRVSEASVCV